MHNLNIKQESIVEDLASVLISYLEPLQLNYRICNQEVYLEEVFMKKGFMPVFLYDKQTLLDTFISTINEESTSTKYFAKILFYKTPQNDSYIDCEVEIIHNLTNKNSEHKYPQYNALIALLAKKILNSQDFILNMDNIKTIDLDNLYKRFYDDVSNKKVTITYDA